MKLLVVGDFQGKFPKKLEKKLKKEEFDLIIGVGDYGGIDDWRPYFKQAFKFSSKGLPYLSAEEYFGKKGLKRLIEKDDEATKKVLRKLNSYGAPFVFVFGNGDDSWYDYPFQKIQVVKPAIKRFLRSMKNFVDINYGRKKINGIKFVGFGGYMDVDANWGKQEDKKKLERKIKRSEKSRKKLNLLMKGFGSEILVLHYPPKGIFDIIRDKGNAYSGKSAGIKSFREAILLHKPKLVLCGHMHEYQGAKRLGKSLVVNPGDAEKNKYAIVDYPSLKVRFE